MKTKKTTAKVALITGGARRIGKSIARILHENGWNVVIHYSKSQRSAEKLELSLNKIRPNSAQILPADLNDSATLEPLIEAAVRCFGRLDALINNASVYYETPILKTNFDTWDHILQVNSKAPFFLAKAAYVELAKRKGSIINIVDIHADRPMRKYPIYSLSKACIAMLTKVLAIEFGPAIRVNSVSPGSIIWPEGKNAHTSQQKKAIIQTTALKKHGDPDDIAKTVLFLVENATYITGQDIAVDGGRSLFIAP